MKKQRSYLEQVHVDGIVWNYIMAGLFLLFPILLCIIFRTLPNWQGLLQGLVATLPMYWAIGIIEIVTYVPMLGAGGSYLSFVTGNISNLKLPCSLEAMKNANVSASTEEGEIISTISIAVSSIVTTFIILLGVLILTPFKESLIDSPILAPAFEQLLPALFGALGVVFISKNWKISIAPIALMLILFIAIPALNEGTVGIMVPVSALFTIGVSRILYNKGLLGNKTATDNLPDKIALDDANCDDTNGDDAE